MVICIICKSKMDIFTRHKSFHRFPKNPSRCKKWIDIIQLDELKLYYRICSDHFEDSDFCFIGNRKRLKPDAVPKPYLISKGTVLPEIDTIPSTSGLQSDELEQSINNSKQIDYFLDSEKRLIREKMEARRKRRTKRLNAMMQSLKRKIDNEDISFEENLPSSQDDQLEFLTIIGDDDDAPVRDEEEHQHERSLSSLLDSSSKVLKNADNDSSSAEDDVHNSPSVLSTSECDEGIEETSSSSKIKRQARFFGDYSSDDMDNPVKARNCWHLAKKTISDLKVRNRLLQRRNHRLTMKIQCLQSLFLYLDENNFLNQYADAVVKAVIKKPQSS